MQFRSSLSGMLLLICLGFCGCDPSGEGQVDEQKNPYFLAGKERNEQRDYKGAIDAFEKALEANAHSALAHFELGVLFEQHTDQKEEDYVAAMFHYQQAIKLRPNEYPADIARQRVAYCKRELVKAESLAPVAQNLMRELDKLRQENLDLHKQLNACLPQPGNRSPLQPRTPTNLHDNVARGLPPARPANDSNLVSRTPAQPFSRERITPLPPVPPATRTHVVKERDTFFSIARQYHVKSEALISVNPNVDAKRLKVGQVITLPPP